MNAITQVLDRVARGDPQSASELLPLMYAELRALATAHLSNEKPGQTLQPTALVHEAYLRLMGDNPSQPWNTRGHFFAAAAEAMRRILVEAARRKAREKHGGQLHRVPLADAPNDDSLPRNDLLDLHAALDRLALEDPAKAELVKLRYFAGLTLEEIAACQSISLATVKRRWTVARAWLFDAISSANRCHP